MSTDKSGKFGAAYHKEWRKSHKESRARSSRKCLLKRVYGLTLEEYEEMLIRQGGLCAICRRVPEESKPWGRLHVDHNHTTKRVRGLLCHRCNFAIGLFSDDLNLLQWAADYVTEA